MVDQSGKQPRLALRLAIALHWKFTNKEGETIAGTKAMAKYLGTTENNVRHILSAFRKAGFVETIEASVRERPAKLRLTLPLKPQPAPPAEQKQAKAPKPRKRVLVPRTAAPAARPTTDDEIPF
jgi:hypothetical protein